MTDDSYSDPDFVVPAPDDTFFKERVPVTENVVPASDDTCTPSAPARQHVALTPDDAYAAPAPAIKHVSLAPGSRVNRDW